MTNWLRGFHQDTSAVTALEYALLGALIAVAIIAGIGDVGTSVKQLYDNIKDQVVLAMQ